MEIEPDRAGSGSLATGRRAQQKRASGGWKSRYLVIQGGCLHVYASRETFRRASPLSSLSLRHLQIDSDPARIGENLQLVLTSASGERLVVAAPSHAVLMHWFNALLRAQGRPQVE